MNLLTPDTLRFGFDYEVGSIGFVRRRAFVSAAIAWCSRWWRDNGEPSVSHVFVVTGPRTIVEANDEGVVQSDLAGYLFDPAYRIYFRQPRGWTPELGRRIALVAASFIGLKYDFDMIAADAVSYSLAGRIINTLTRNCFDKAVTKMAYSKGAMICDMVAVEAMKAQKELRALGTMREPSRTNNPQKLFGDDAVFEPDTIAVKGDTLFKWQR